MPLSSFHELGDHIIEVYNIMTTFEFYKQSSIHNKTIIILQAFKLHYHKKCKYKIFQWHQGIYKFNIKLFDL